jgi:hypothetical protein
MEKAHLPSGIRERLYKEEFSSNELRTFLSYLQHVCECTEIKKKQFNEAKKEPANADEDDGINVGVKI